MANKYIDYKITVWRRLHLKDSTKVKTLVKQLEGKTINTADDLMGIIENWDDIYDDCDEMLSETADDMKREVNEGSTIELYSNDEMIWSN